MIGQTAGKYRIIARLGRGSMGTVFRAMDETLHRDVAIKVLNTELGDPAARRRFHAEAVAIARLNHHGIAKIFELFEHDGLWLMAMELLPGETLEALIQRAGPMPVQTAADLAMQALSALDHAHGLGVVHRDLKPANLMVADGQLTITDFGIARVAGSERLTSAGLMMGTPAYMAPEQVLGHDVDARADLFAVGCVLFHMCTAKLPFPGETPMALVQARLHETPTPARTLRSDLPDWVDQVVRRALARDRDARFASATEFRDAIERGLTGRPISAAPVPVATVPETASAIGETILPGSVPVPVSVPVPAAMHDVAETTLQPRAAMPGSQPAHASVATRPAARPRFAGLWPLAGIAVVALIGAVLWLRPDAEPPTEVSAGDSAIAPAPPVPDAGTVTSSPPVEVPLTPVPPGAGGKPAPTPTPAAAAGRRGALLDKAITFTNIKVLEVVERRGTDEDASLTIGGGRLTIVPARAGAAQVSFPYATIRAATYTKDRTPRWASNLAAPPDGLDLPGGSLLHLGRRPVRNWLVIQSQAWFLILALTDADVDPVLTALADRSRVKISRPGTRP